MGTKIAVLELYSIGIESPFQSKFMDSGKDLDGKGKCF